jgi:C-terminal processing protease CtpA/Prc
MLHRAYEDVKKNYYDPAYHGVDLEAVYHKYDARLDSAQSLNEAFRVIGAFLSALNDSHTFFLPPMRAHRSTSGYTMEMIGDKCLVTHIRPGSDAATKLHIGDQVVSLDGFSVTRHEFLRMEYFLEILSPMQTETLVVQGPSGERRQETIQPMVRTGRVELDLTGRGGGVDNFDLMRENENTARLDRERIFESGDVLIWKMPSFSTSREIVDSAFSEARKHKVLILDLRGNPGGSVDTLKEALGGVFDHEVTLFKRVSRKDSKPEEIKAKGHAFTGKLIVLIDSKSASAAELFARVVQIEHRGEVIGDRSAGAVMEARGFDEWIGPETRVFFGFSITSADLIMTDGKSLENVGVTPDEIVLPSAADMAEGKDPVLARAAELAGVKLDPVRAGMLFPFEWASL